MRNSSVTERVQQLEGHSREVKDRLAGLVTRSEGESAEWLNSLIENFFWPRMLRLAWERDLRAEVDAQLTARTLITLPTLTPPLSVAAVAVRCGCAINPPDGTATATRNPLRAS